MSDGVIEGPRRYKKPSPEASFRRAVRAATKAAPPGHAICAKEAHRDSGLDWRHPGGTKTICGVCHPSPYSPAWDEWKARQQPVGR